MAFSGKILTSTVLGMLRPLPLAGLLLAAPFAIAPAFAAKGDLPKPFVSRALDATLMPVTDKVRAKFKLKPSAKGVYVVSTDPKGVAAKYNIKPGDVISTVKGKKIVKPIDLDEVVLYWLKKDAKSFKVGGTRNGVVFNVEPVITLVLFEAVIDVANIIDWFAGPSIGAFSYTEYYTEYSSEISYDYEVSETLIEETVTSESYETEITEEYSSEEYSEEYSEESTSEESSEESYSEESSEESSEEYSEESSEESYSEDSEDEETAMEDEESQDDEATDDEASDDEAYDDEAAEDEDESADDSSDEDESSDEGDEESSDEGGDEEEPESR